MAEHESAFAAAVAAVRPLLLGGTIRDAERIVLAALRAANAAGGAELAAANERAEKAEAELAEVRNWMADPYNPRHIAQAYSRAIEAGNEAVARIEAERDKARARLDKADLRAAKLRLVAASMLRTFTTGQSVHPGYAAKVSHPVPVADVERWQTVVRETSLAADAAQDGRSATETDGEGSQAHGDGSNSSTTAAGPSETCGNKLDYHMCFLPAGHDGDHRDSFNWTWMTHLGTWPDDETEAEQ